MKIRAFKLDHARLCKEYSEPAMWGR
jgi:hypothetical protein